MKWPAMNDKLKYFLWISLAILSTCILWYFKSIVFFLIVSVVLSLITRPFFDLIKRIRIKKWSPSNALSALITILLIWIFIIAFFWLNIPLVLEEIQFLSKIDPDILFDKIGKSFDPIWSPLKQMEILNSSRLILEDYLKNAVSNLMDFSRIKELVTSLFDVLGGTIIFVFSVTFMTFFFLKEEWLIIEGLLLFIPSNYEDGLKHMLNSIKTLLRRYFLGVLLQITLISLFVTFGFLLIGVGIEHAMIIGLFAGFINVIPYLGPLIGAFFGISVGLIVYVQMPFTTTFLSFVGETMLVFIIVQTMDNIIFQPIIFSSSVRAHPLEIFIIILMAGYISGIFGMFLAIPAYTIIRVVAREFFYNYKLVKKLTEKL